MQNHIFDVHTMGALFKRVSVFASVLLLAACASLGPNNTVSDGADGQLALKGHDPVAYFVVGKHVLGNPTLKAEYNGATYRFSSEANRDQFIKEPARFAPQFGGFCANGIAYGIPWGGDPDTWKIIDGKLYIFGGESSKKYFLMDEAANMALANRYWNDEVNGSNALVQRYKRLVLRVPHYKTGQALEVEWQRRQTTK